MISRKFRIVNPPAGIISPAEGEPWELGTQKEIMWRKGFSAMNVKISLSLNNGDTWKIISPCSPNCGHFTFLVPGELASNDCLIKIEEVQI